MLHGTVVALRYCRFNKMSNEFNDKKKVQNNLFRNRIHQIAVIFHLYGSQ